jgi:putative transcriptional regulator
MNKNKYFIYKINFTQRKIYRCRDRTAPTVAVCAIQTILYGALRQEDMSVQLGVSRQTIIAIENDKYNPALELAMKIVRLFSRGAEDIVTFSLG